jgi:hypothetical protein
MRIGIVILVAAGLLVADGLSSARAQGGFFDKGLDRLKGMGGGAPKSGGALGTSEIAGGLREALTTGVRRVVGTLGVSDGFLNRPDVHIPLPDSLRRVQSALSRVGMGATGKELEVKLNRAAEAAVPKVEQLFVGAIRKMTVDDARKILNGPKDAATQYFRGKMSAPLAKEMQPIVESQLSEVGAVQTYERMTSDYRKLPFMPDVKADLTRHVLEKAVGGIFLYLGREEAAIRADPAKRTTDLLRKVFGS